MRRRFPSNIPVSSEKLREVRNIHPQLVSACEDDFGGRVQVFKAVHLGSAPIGVPNNASQEDLDEAMAHCAGDIAQVASHEKVFFVIGKHSVGAVSRSNDDDTNITMLAPTTAVKTFLVLPDKKRFCYVTTNDCFSFSFCHVMQLKKLAKHADEAMTAVVRTNSNSVASFTVKTDLQRKASDSFATLTCRSSGTIPLSSSGSDGDCLAAFQSVAEKSANKQSHVVVVVSSDSIRTFEALTEEVRDTFPILSVTFSTVVNDDEFGAAFVFVCNDERRQAITCHMFSLPANEDAHADAEHVCQVVTETRNKAMVQMQTLSMDPFAIVEETEPLPEGHPMYLHQIPRDALIAVTVLGAGQFGTVHLGVRTYEDENGRDLKPPEQVAVKTLRAGAASSDQEEFLKEASAMIEFQHPNVCKLIGVCVGGTPWMLVLEFMMYGDMRGVLRAFGARNIPLQLSELLHACKQVLEGMKYIAAQGYVHMDLASRNLLLHAKSLVKIGDFGITQKVDMKTGHFRLRKHLRLAVRWMAPETLGGKKITFCGKV
eukprot:m.276786 g.276786  ORF g.276786 m.276786 type:complete len:542 (-) comp19366_c0_seq34:787-2412(-)